MRKKLLVLGFATALLWLGYTLFMHITKQVLGNIVDDVLTRSYLEQSHTPTVAEIEALTRMKLPNGYRDLKALSHVEPREPKDDFMMVKLSAERSEIKKALSAAGLYGERKVKLKPWSSKGWGLVDGLYGDMELNPKDRSIVNGEIKIPWWNPDAEKNVLSGHYYIRSSTDQQAGKAWDISILIAQHEKGLDTLYLQVRRLF